MPIKGEVDLSPLFSKSSDKHLYLTKTLHNTKHLDIHRVKSPDDLEPGSFSILEPKDTIPPENPKIIQLALVPGVAFDYSGHRIGYGHGFFDRLLKKTNCYKIGIAYEFQIVKNVGGEIHDVPVDMIITEKRIIKIKNP